MRNSFFQTAVPTHCHPAFAAGNLALWSDPQVILYFWRVAHPELLGLVTKEAGSGRDVKASVSQSAGLPAATAGPGAHSTRNIPILNEFPTNLFA